MLATVIANKTLSPQYILWLGGPVAALLVTRGSAWLRRHLIVFAVALVIVGALTQMTYPWGAYGIMAIPLGSGPETSVLLLRNLALVVPDRVRLRLTWRQPARRLRRTGASILPRVEAAATPRLMWVSCRGQQQPQSSAATQDS